MIVGILSDTHGQARRTATAIRMLQQAGAEEFVHCGDIGGAPVLDQLAGLKIHIVCGNTDCPNSELVEYAASLGLQIGLPSPRRVEIGGRKMVVCHGHEPEFGQLIAETAHNHPAKAAYGDCEYLLHGHTHVPVDRVIGHWHVINPGALHRARVHSVATLDLRSDVTKFWRVFDDAEGGSLQRFHPQSGLQAPRSTW